MQRKLDYTDIWTDAVALLNSHKEAILAIAGVFLFLPHWASGFLSGNPDIEAAEDIAEILVIMEDYWAANWSKFLIAAVLGFFGNICIYVLVVGRGVDRIGDALSRAFTLILIFFAAQILAGIATFFAAMAFIIPGLYLIGRLAPLLVVIAAEDRVGVLGGIARSWDLTRGIGWAIFFLLLIVGLMAWIIVFVIQLVVNLIVALAFGSIFLVETGLNALGQAAISVVMAMLAIAIYRHLSAQDAA